MKILKTKIIKYVQINTESHTFKVQDDGTVWMWSSDDDEWIDAYYDFEGDDYNLIAAAGLAELNKQEQ